jgi:hypothetical protein
MSITTADGFVHPALLYRDRDEYLAGSVSFIRDGLAAGEPVAVAVPTGNLRLLRDVLGDDAGQVMWRDMTVAGRNPGRIIPTVLLAFASAHTGRRVRIIGEPIWAGRTAMEYPACAQHEALINVAFADQAATILCPYDVSRLDPAWVRDAHRTHPVIWDGVQRIDSYQYGDPITVATDVNRPLPDPPPGAAAIVVELSSLAMVRRFVADMATRAGLPQQRVADAVLAVSEVTANTGRARWRHRDPRRMD